MPIEIETRTDYFYVRLSGQISVIDLQMLVDEAERLEALYPDRDRVIDTTNVQRFDLRFEDMFAIAQRRATQNFGRAVKSAVIASAPIQVGFARMFQMLNDSAQIEVRVVQDIGEALTWFEAPS